jgi:hypothetical protein
LQVLGFVADARAAADTNGDISSIALWEAQAVLLLWLSILVLIPFDLVILDSEVTSDSSRAAAQLAYTPLAGRIMRLCQGYLQHPGVLVMLLFWNRSISSSSGRSGHTGMICTYPQLQGTFYWSLPAQPTQLT